MKSGRRSFLAAALAWLASLVALVWPRRALAEPARPRGGFTRPTAPAEPSPVAWGDCEYRQTIREYKDSARMFDEMFDHLCNTGHSILSADEPEHRMIGFVTFDATPGAPEARVHWCCRLTAVKFLFEDGGPRCFRQNSSPQAVEVVRNCFISSHGRQVLCQALEAAGRKRFTEGLGPLPA